jgi:hypothetical protein
MSVLRQLFFVLSSHLKMLLCIGSNPNNTYNVIACLLKDNVKELFSYDSFPPGVPDLVKIEIMLQK